MLRRIVFLSSLALSRSFLPPLNPNKPVKHINDDMRVFHPVHKTATALALDFFGLGPPEILVIVVAGVLLFGY
jgi:hypothetical protein